MVSRLVTRALSACCRSACRWPLFAGPSVAGRPRHRCRSGAIAARRRHTAAAPARQSSGRTAIWSRGPTDATTGRPAAPDASLASTPVAARSRHCWIVSAVPAGSGLWHDLTIVVETASRADMVRSLHLTAIRAFIVGGRRQRIMRPAHVTAGFRLLVLGNGHWCNPVDTSDRRYAPGCGSFRKPTGRPTDGSRKPHCVMDSMPPDKRNSAPPPHQHQVSRPPFKVPRTANGCGRPAGRPIPGTGDASPTDTAGPASGWRG